MLEAIYEFLIWITTYEFQEWFPLLNNGALVLAA